jgi:hypothetical protein
VIVGIDFDNTIAGYDEPMHRWAVERGLIPPELPKSKKAIRDALRALEDGETKWRALQVHSYGPGMPEAHPMEGVREFIATCKARGVEVLIVSHKTEYANFGDPTVNLREAALRWLEAQGFIDSPRFGVGRDHIFFESTREEKIARIRSLGITHFIDDLEETFLEDSFPVEVARILFSSQPEHNGRGRWQAFASWPEIQRHLLGGAPQEDLDALRALLGRAVDSAERVGAGRNSRVYRVHCGSEEYAAKFYFRPTADGRDRLQVEFAALEFLWRRGLRCIAEPLKADTKRQLALYRFVEGEAVDATTVSASDLGQLIEFVRELKRISCEPAARDLHPAAEAFFRVPDVIANVAQRVARLEAIEGDGPSFAALRAFLKDLFVPAFRDFGEAARSRAMDELEWRYRTLSPSDLGFHNALRGPDGRLTFLDFEYFGWDDPAKTLSDCLLHPMMRLAPERKRQLAGEFDRIFGTDPGWRARVSALYPLFALKWCMIMLNEFRPEQIERRRYVDRTPEEAQAIQLRQLAAARGLLERLLTDKGAFPYWEQTK